MPINSLARKDQIEPHAQNIRDREKNRQGGTADTPVQRGTAPGTVITDHQSQPPAAASVYPGAAIVILQKKVPALVEQK